jgi:uncharacterized membrane protein (UPF0127 family)
MLFFKRYRYALALAVLLAAAVAIWLAVNQFSASGPSSRIVLVTNSGEHTFTVEWALTPEDRARGLMFREQMAPEQGMLFDFMVEEPVSFWMKNTPLSLDIIFIHANGTVARIARNTVPFSERTIPSGASVRYVLEVVAGTADRIGLVGGDKVRLR